MTIKISEYVRQYLQKNNETIQKDNLSASKIAKNIFLENKELEKRYSNNLENFIRIINKFKKTIINIDLSQKQPRELITHYEVKDNDYHFFPIKGTFSLPIEVVDDIFHDFSKHGLDLSTTQIMLKYNIEPWQWHALKNALKLYKTSHIFSPYSTQNISADELKRVISEKMNQKVNTVSFQVENQYNQSIIKKYKEIISKHTLRDLEIKTIVNEVADYLLEAKIQPVVSVNSKHSHKEINVILADLHFGAKNQTNPHLPEYSVEKLVSYFEDQIIPTINSYNAEKVNVFICGDIVESFTGLNHIDSWKGIQEGFYGANLVKECYRFLVDIISKIHNVKSVIGVSGNHDRATPNKEHDNEGFIAEIIFEFLNISFRNSNIKVIFDNKLQNLMIDDICYIMSHGHEKISNNASNLVLKYGSQNHYNILLSGHLHSRMIKEDTENFRQIVCPSIFPGNNYSVSLGFSTQPGFLIIYNNGKGKSVIHDYSL